MTEQPTVGRDEVEVAHEALIRHWPRLRAWLDQDRAALLLRESIREAAQEWVRHGQDESYLAHRGRRLAEAEALAHHPRFTLNAQDQAYLDAAIALRDREQQERKAQQQRELAAARQSAAEAEARREAESAARGEAEQRVAEQALAARGLRRRFVVAAGLGALALFAAIGAFWGFRQASEQQAVAEAQREVADEQRVVAVAAAATAEAERDRADEQARISLIQALAAQAVTEAERDEHERGALLARQAYLFDEAIGSPVRDSVDASLRAALGVPYFSPRFRGHEDAVYSVAFAPDGQTLASAGQDGTVRLWDPARPDAVPIVLVGHEDSVWSVAFSPDGLTLALGSEDGTVQLWLARTETLADLVCSRVWRNLTLDEWRRFVGDPEQIPYQSTCRNLPPGEGMVMATPTIGTPATLSASPAPG